VRTIDVRNPRSGAMDYSIEAAGDADIAAVAVGLRTSQPGWQALGTDGRAGTLEAFRDALARHESGIYEALSTDTGRFAIARAELGGLLAGIDRWCATARSLGPAPERASKAFPHVGLQQRQRPYPLVGAIGPWNFPLLLSFIDAIPALLAGCAVIIKPSEVTPRFAAPVRRAIAEVPELSKVLEIVDGDGSTGAALVGQVDAVAFTGSVATGRKVAESAARAFIPAFLELGGKDPAIVLASADLERAATAILRASVNASGQACQSLERIYVSRNRHDDFVKLLANKASATPLSYPDPHTGIVGPLIFARQAEIIAAHLEDAFARGAAAVTGGEVKNLDGGYFVEPTVLTGVTHDMRVMTEETFGPIMPVMAFDDEEEAVALANDSAYGLSAAVFAADEAAATRIAERLDAGGVSINDAGLTAMIFEAEKSAFRNSGLGPSRMGASGLTRFFRQQALYLNRGKVLPVEAFAEQGD